MDQFPQTTTNKNQHRKIEVFSDLKKKNVQFRIWGLGAFKGTARACYEFEPSVSLTERGKENTTV